MARKPKSQREEEQPAEPTFEAALARLEEIATRLESDALSLEEAIALAEEGQRLVGVCERCLSQAESKIQQLVEQAGKLRLEPVEVEETAGEGPT